jgi:hypothetical protein
MQNNYKKNLLLYFKRKTRVFNVDLAVDSAYFHRIVAENS